MASEARETTTLIESDKVEGTAVHGRDENKIGNIERVIARPKRTILLRHALKQHDPGRSPSLARDCPRRALSLGLTPGRPPARAGVRGRGFTSVHPCPDRA